MVAGIWDNCLLCMFHFVLLLKGETNGNGWETNFNGWADKQVKNETNYWSKIDSNLVSLWMSLC